MEITMRDIQMSSQIDALNHIHVRFPNQLINVRIHN